MEITCILVDDESLAREVLSQYIQNIPFLRLLGSFDRAQEAIAFLRKNQVELLFTDIEMPEVSGISLLRNLPYRPLVVLISAHSSYAAQGFDLGVVDYLVKPFSEGRLLMAVNKAVKAIKANKGGVLQQNFITIKDRHYNILLELVEILYTEGMGDYVKIVTRDKNYSIKKNLKDMEEKLPSDKFMRVHKSYIINTTLISSISASEVKLKGLDKAIPLGSNFRGELFRKFGIS